MKDNVSMPMLTLANGRKVMDLIPNDNSRVGALVDLAVLKRLTSLLERTDLREIKVTFCNNILQNANDMTAYVNILEEELAFQKSVNLIKVVQLEEPVAGDYVPEPRYSE